MKESHASVFRGMVIPARLFCIATSRSLPSPHEPYTRGDRADAANSASERWTDSRSRTPPQEHKRLNVGERVRGSTPNNQAFARARDSAFTELLLDTQYRGLLYTLRGITSPCLHSSPLCAVSPMWDAPPSMAPRSVCKDECARERLICPSLSR